MGKEVLVTGAGGFIGSHLTEALVKEGANVSVLLRYTSEKNIGNLRYLDKDLYDQIDLNFGTVEDRTFVNSLARDKEIIFHLAALIGIPYSYVAPESYVSTNIIGTLNFLNAAREFEPDVALFTSTSEVYGTANYVPIDEKHPLKGQSPYSATKIGADKLIESYFLSFDCPIVTVRPFNTYGPRQSDRAVIPTIISQAMFNDTIRLGDLSPTRDYVYVRDTVDGFIQLAKKKPFGEVVNLATGKEFKIGDIVDLVQENLNTDKKVVSESQRMRPSKSEVRQLLGDAGKANSLGWSPKYSFAKGLDETIKWFKQHEKYSKKDQSRYSV